MEKKSVTIIIPTFNRATIIPFTLDSVMNQQFAEWVCIVVDDFSTDNTKDIVNNYKAKDNRFRYQLNERKKGAQGARNTGLYYCDTEWVVFFDSDNIMHPDFLSKLLSKATEEVDVVQCFSNVISVNSKELKNIFCWRSYGNIQSQLYSLQTYVDFNQAIIRRNLLLDIGGLDEDCPSMQEWDTHIRLSKVARYITIEEPLLDYYIEGTDAISSDKKREVIGRLYILRKHLAEWRKHKNAYKNYIHNIEMYIELNTDLKFKKLAYRQLRCMAWDAYLMIGIGNVKSALKSVCHIIK